MMLAPVLVLLALGAPSPDAPADDEVRRLTRDVEEMRAEVERLRRQAAERPSAPEETADEARKALRTLSEDEPLHIQDASPADGLELGLAFLASAREGHPRWDARPTIDLGIRDRFSVGGSVALGYRDGDTGAGPGEVHVLARVLHPQGAPAVSVFAQGRAGGGEERAARGLAIATQELGATRLHVMGGFRVVDGAANEAEAAGGVDHVFGDRLLAGLDGWLEAPTDGSAVTAGGDVGAIARVSDRLLVEGAAGIASRSGALEPRLVFAVVWRL